MSSHKNVVKEKGSLLETLLDDSNRLAPFTLALLDDLPSTDSMSAYRRHLIKRWTEEEPVGANKRKKNSPPKHMTILCLQSDTKEAFVRTAGNASAINANITLVDEEDLSSGDEGDLLKSESVLQKLSAGNKQSGDNVLVIDSVIPLLLMSNQVSTSMESATKAVAGWLVRLHEFFSQVVFTLHTDVFAAQFVELGLSHISTAVIDFRQTLNGSNRLQISCPLVKLLQEMSLEDGGKGQNSNSVHVQVLTRKKHPRTHLKVTRRHEHFQVDQQTGHIISFLSSEDLAKVLQKSRQEEAKTLAAETETPLPSSTFNLGLKKEEQEAKDSLILPYIRKNLTSTMNTTLGGQVATNLTTANNKSGGQVVYHYDQFDDFDEDDPDDDLDF